MTRTTDPFQSFRFLVEFDRIRRGGFNKVKGVAREVKVDSYHEGGLNEFEHKLAGHTSYGSLTLERGIVDDILWSWQQETTDGRVRRRDMTIVLRDGRNAEVWRWLVDGAFPVKWSASDLDASGGHVLVESADFVHRGIRKG